MMAATHKEASGIPGSPLLKRALGVILILVGAGLFYLQFPSPPLEKGIHEQMGKALAAEAAKLVGGGGRIVVVNRNVLTGDQPAGKVEMKALVDGLQSAQRKVALTNIVKIDPLRIPMVLPGDFFEMLRRTGPEDVVISFMGPPWLTEGQRKQLEGKMPKVVAVATGALARQGKLEDLFKHKLVTVAVVDRSVTSSRSTSEAGASPRFEDLYQIVTESSAAQILGGTTP